MLIPNATSEDFPNYMKISNSPVQRLSVKQTQKGKKCFPDKTIGVSEEVPSYFRYQHQLISSCSKPNPLNDENHIKKSITNFKLSQCHNGDQGSKKIMRKSFSIQELQPNQSLINMKQSIIQSSVQSPQGRNTASLANYNTQTSNLNDYMLMNTYNQSHQGKILFSEQELPKDNKMRASMKLLKHSKLIQYKNQGINLHETHEDPRKHKQFDGEVMISASFKGFQDFDIKNEYNKAKQNQIKIELDRVPIYDCITNTQKVVQPPPIEIDSYSKLRENYYKLLGTVPKPFNRKQGIFSDYCDKTHYWSVKDKAWKEMQIYKESGMQELQNTQQPLSSTQSQKKLRYTSNTQIESDFNDRDFKSSTLPPISLQRNLQKINEDYDEDVSSRSLLNSLNKRVNDKNFGTIQPIISEFTQTMNLKQEFNNPLNVEQHQDQLDNVPFQTQKLEMSTSTKAFHKKLQLQSVVLKNMLPYQQSVQDLRSIVEPKIRMKKYPRNISQEEIKWMRRMNAERDQRDKSLEDMKQLKWFEEKLKLEQRQALQLNPNQTDSSGLNNTLTDTTLINSTNNASPSLDNKSQQTNKTFSRHSSMYFKTALKK